MSYGFDLSGLSFGDADIGEDIAQTLKQALSGVSFGADEIGADDLLGALAESGADADVLGAVAEEIGASRRRSKKSRRAQALARAMRGGSSAVPQAALAQALNHLAVANQPRQGAGVIGGFGSVSAVNTNAKPTAMGGRFMPMSVTSIAASTSSVQTFNPQEDFRPEKIVYAGPASTFFISDLRIKNQPQSISAGEVPADAFAPNAADIRLNFSACPVGGQIQMTIRNATGAAAAFSAMMVGSAALMA